ncbi:MAG: HDOD domain-containing protein, partial [Deltaproteobacteria bacterium]|nr:HDOD domain-containing protein [Deltaproteobacteria bacterium]
LGASKENIVAEIAGGALMLINQKLSTDMNIGRRNSDRAQEILVQEGIPILNKAIGGYSRRMLSLNPNNGKTIIRCAGEKADKGGSPVRLGKIDPDDFIKGIDGLKPVPETARRIISLIEFSSGYNPAHLESYVLKDPAICANVLKMCNAAQPGFRHKVQTVSNAVSLLGMDTLKDIVLAASAYKLYDKAPKGYSTEAEILSRHSICCESHTDRGDCGDGMGTATGACRGDLFPPRTRKGIGELESCLSGAYCGYSLLHVRGGIQLFCPGRPFPSTCPVCP